MAMRHCIDAARNAKSQPIAVDFDHGVDFYYTRRRPRLHIKPLKTGTFSLCVGCAGRICVSFLYSTERKRLNQTPQAPVIP